MEVKEEVTIEVKRLPLPAPTPSHFDTSTGSVYEGKTLRVSRRAWPFGALRARHAPQEPRPASGQRNKGYFWETEQTGRTVKPL